MTYIEYKDKHVIDKHTAEIDKLAAYALVIAGYKTTQPTRGGGVNVGLDREHPGPHLGSVEAVQLAVLGDPDDAILNGRWK